MTFQLAIARHMFGLLRPEDLPQVATLAMMQGHDSPSMIRLAGEVSSLTSPTELRALWDSAVLETAIRLPQPLEAARLLVRHYAGQIADGKLAPQVGLGMIYGVYIEADRQVEETSDVAEQLGIGNLMDAYYGYDDIGPNEVGIMNADVIVECVRVIDGSEG